MSTAIATVFFFRKNKQKTNNLDDILCGQIGINLSDSKP